ncbi:MAG: hypothetical protein HKN12_11610, partial [Gemmatimonadetes bacterium]|nr:hypothetical protein [Gemmatimonadota bacterium]
MKPHRPLPLLLFTASALCLFTVTAASAQSGWNRHAEAVAVTASPAGGFDVQAIFEIHLEGTHSTTLDLGTTVDLSLNGTVIASQTIPVGTDPNAGMGCVDAAACGGGCGTGTADGTPYALLCLPEGACGALCDCKCKFP